MNGNEIRVIIRERSVYNPQRVLLGLRLWVQAAVEVVHKMNIQDFHSPDPAVVSTTNSSGSLKDGTS